MPNHNTDRDSNPRNQAEGARPRGVDGHKGEPLEPQSVGPVRRGSKPGSFRVTVPRERALRRLAPRRWRAGTSADTAEPARFRWLRRLVFGRPLATSEEADERLDKKRALAVFASDALSSTAYATEEILRVLVIAGAALLGAALPISLAIGVLLLVVIFSYRQTVFGYPDGGGAYAVARDNLGTLPALVAAAALLTDYVLTVAVSISAGALAVVSALPVLDGYEVVIALGGLFLVTAINLRGVRESGSTFAVLTYFFVGTFALMLAVGLVRLALGSFAEASLTDSAPPRAALVPASSVGVLLLLRAFASGATALTGVEAIANGVTAFRPPEPRNAATTMSLMGGILGCFFVGATFLTVRLGVVPTAEVSVISQVGREVFGGALPLYYLLQGATAIVLILAANTAFNGFPRLAALLARDRFMPRRFGFLDDRLTYSVGILVLASIAGGLLLGFGADTHRLIPLYAVGVFVSFTLSQAGMVRHWRRTAGPGVAPLINATGAFATGVVALVVAGTKFTHGAWMVVILIPLLVTALRATRAHYERISAVLALRDDEFPLRRTTVPVSHAPIVIPVRHLDRRTRRALQYACSLSDRVTAIHVTRSADAETDAFVERWAELVPDVPMVVVESPFRTFLGPFFSYVDRLPREQGTVITVVVPELATVHWWERLFHNSTARLIERAVAKRPYLVMTSAIARAEAMR